MGDRPDKATVGSPWPFYGTCAECPQDPTAKGRYDRQRPWECRNRDRYDHRHPYPPAAYAEHVLGIAPDGTPTPEMQRPELRTSDAKAADPAKAFRERHIKCSMYDDTRVYKHNPDCEHQDE